MRPHLIAAHDGVPRTATLAHGFGFGALRHNFYLVHGPWKYIWWYPATNEEQLFDLGRDPHELGDRSNDGAGREPLRRLMADWLRPRDDVRYDAASLRPCDNAPPRVFWAGPAAS